MTKDVPRPSKHPVITFQSSSVQPREGRYLAKGELSLRGVKKNVEFNIDGDGKNFTGMVALAQKDYGIKPFKALMGALKVRNEVKIGFDLSL